MFNQKSDKIKKIIEDFFKKGAFLASIEVLKTEEETITVRIKTEEPKILIGQNGQTLRDIHHLLRLILKKQLQRDFYLDVDINDYKKKKSEYLKETARSLADEVSLGGKEKILDPMSSYERRVIHLELQDRADVITESIGEGEERKIVIKPKK